VLFHFKEYLPDAVPRPIPDSGYLAVDLFFELSGFIITLNYLRGFETISPKAIPAFLSVRLARIYPLHIFMLALFLINPIAIAMAGGTLGPAYDPQYFLLSLALIQDWGFTSSIGAWNVPAWSISTEWFAYLLFPLLAWCSCRWIRGRSHAVGAAVLLLVGLALFFAGTSGSLREAIRYTGLPRCLMEFTIGIGIYFFWAYRPKSRPSETWAALTGALAALGGFAFLGIADYIVVPAGFMCLIYALTNETSLAARGVSLPPFHFAGLISYSTYLSHYFIRDWIKLTLVGSVSPWLATAAYLGLTALASVLLYRYVEVPSRTRVRGWAKGHLAGSALDPVFGPSGGHRRDRTATAE
jgi:peptidoglycan/LPS O-acetylase OafA/YrhL